MRNDIETPAPETAAEESPGANHNTLPSPDAPLSHESDAPPVEQTNGLDTPAPVTLGDITGLHTGSHAEFDPALHAVDEYGQPRRKTDGSFALKRGRKAGQKAAGPGTAPDKTPAPAKAPTPRSDADEIAEAARTAANLTIWGSVAIFGEDFVPEKHEPNMLFSAYRDYFAEKGVSKLPPELGLIVALAAYAGPRLAKPTTRTRLATLWIKTRDFFGKFKRKPKGDASKEGN